LFNNWLFFQETQVVDKYFIEQLELELSSVNTMLDSKTIDIYVHWLLRFHRYKEAVSVRS
jgi:hypothetical protein